MFTNEFGGHLDGTTAWRYFKKVAKRIGVEDMRFHDLRHTYAMNAMHSGDDAKVVQKNMGHHTAAFTLDQYGHVSASMDKESAARMESFIQSLES